jgi:parallel beta helix pectate lyase-like protein
MYDPTVARETKLRTILTLLLAAALLCACTGSVTLTEKRDDTTDLQKKVDAGGLVTLQRRKYLLTRTIVVRKSNTVIQGSGPRTVLEFRPTLPQIGCVNDRAITTACDVVPVARRQIAAPIEIGDHSFTAVGDASDLRAGDWLIVTEMDRRIGGVVVVDWAQVQAASGTTIEVRMPFRTTFPNARTWDPDNSGLGFSKLPRLTEGIQFRNLSIAVPDSGENAPGISVYAALHTSIENVTVHDFNGQALYCYLSKDIVIKNSTANSGAGLNEFAATVDLELNGNTLSSDANAGAGLDLGTGFFRVIENKIPTSHNAGMYLLYGVHDGTMSNNRISSVKSSGNAIGILARGTQNVRIANNFLAGGEGIASQGISIGPEFTADVPIPSRNNTVTPNRFGPPWSLKYDPSNR